MTELNNKHVPETPEKEPEYTHKVTLTMYSNGPEDMWLSMEWTPDLDGKDIEALGYIPASFDFAQDYILPALEKAEADEWDRDPLSEMPSPSNRRN